MLREFRYPRCWLGLWIAALVATVIVCLLPLPPVPLPVNHFDKLEHAVGYALLAAWAAMLFATRRGLIGSALGLLAFGIGIEGLQAMVSWRSASVGDLLANAVGTLLGAGAWFTPAAQWLQRFERRLP